MDVNGVYKPTFSYNCGVYKPTMEIGSHDKYNNHENAGSILYADGHVEYFRGEDWYKNANNPELEELCLKHATPDHRETADILSSYFCSCIFY